MRAIELIEKKRDGMTLTDEEIAFFVRGVEKGTIPDYQSAAFLMAVRLRGMEPTETAAFTRALAASGERIDLSGSAGTKADKHSTGGVGDKTTLVVGPLVAALGLPFGHICGRGLGHTGGTADKLEAIPGFRARLTAEEFAAAHRAAGIVIGAPTERFSPAEARLYELRDATATVDSIPLIASSVLAKKIAGGAEAVVFDVKTGEGSFMKTQTDALALSRTLVEIAQSVGLRAVALVTDMDQPLGAAVGNALEVREAIETLSGRGPADLEELALEIATQMLLLSAVETDYRRAKSRMLAAIDSGAALERFARMVESQGGDPALARDPARHLPVAPVTLDVLAVREGYVERLDARRVGMAACTLGAGRARREDPVDPAAGVLLHKKAGDFVESGAKLATVHSPDLKRARDAYDRVLEAYSFTPRMPRLPSLIYTVVDEAGATPYDLFYRK